MMKRLSRSVLGCCYLLCFSGALVANEDSDNSRLDETVSSSENISLNSEEIQYILQECESFADEDSISGEERADYIETCFSELSIAVKDAIEKLKADPESVVKDKNESNEDKDKK